MARPHRLTTRLMARSALFARNVSGKAGARRRRRVQLTDAMIALARTQPFYGLKFDGRSFDCGSKIGFLAANVAYALAREDIALPRRDQENPRRVQRRLGGYSQKAGPMSLQSESGRIAARQRNDAKCHERP